MCSRFLPRHTDEIEIEIGDPVYVQVRHTYIVCRHITFGSVFERDKVFRQFLHSLHAIISGSSLRFFILSMRCKSEYVSLVSLKSQTKYVGNLVLKGCWMKTFFLSVQNLILDRSIFKFSVLVFSYWIMVEYLTERGGWPLVRRNQLENRAAGVSHLQLSRKTT